MMIAGLLAIGAGTLKIRDVRRRPGEPSLRALCVGLLAFGAAFLVLAPPHTGLVSDLMHLGNGGRLLGNVLTLASAGALQVMMLHLAHPAEAARPRVRVRLIVLAGVAVTMTVLMIVARTENETNFVQRYATYPPITVYQLVYLSYLAVAVVDLIHLSVRYSRHASTMLRVGLRLVAAGGVVCGVHVAYKVLLIGAEWSGRRPPGNESVVAGTIAAAAGVLIAAGTTLPVWGPYAVLPWQRIRQYRSYRRLEPLWRELSAAVPEIMLTSAQAVAGGYRSWAIGIRLYRRVIEIRDAQLLLRSYVDPDVIRAAEARARARGLTGEQLRAEVDAAALAAAVAEVRRTPGPGRPAADPPGEIVGAASLSNESRYLEQVAAAFVAIAR